MTSQQAESFLRLLSWRDAVVVELHHGDCVGGDADADAIAEALGILRVGHPPDNDALRAHCRVEKELPPEPYKARNRAIVLASCPLVGIPATAQEQKYGGTWGTIRFARGLKRPLLIIRPDGRIVAERTHGLFFGY